jgi:hypothetical protein
MSKTFVTDTPDIREEVSPKQIRAGGKERAEKRRNDIRELKSTRQLKYVKLDLMSPMLREAMGALGL